MKLNKAIATILLLILSATAIADVSLPAVIDNNMVLQQQMNVPIWGFASPGEDITVSPSWGFFTKASTKANTNGKWMLRIKTPEASNEKHTLTISGENTIKLNNVLVGEVWVCSGQSNMEMGLMRNDPWTKGVFNYKSEIKSANYPDIRLFTVAQNFADTPQDDCTGTWSVCSPKTIPDFSAAAYFFARKIHKETGLPIGLLDISWGGTPAEAWTSERVLKKMPDFAPIIEKLNSPDDEIEKLKKEYDQELAKWSKDLDDAVAKASQNAQNANADDSTWATMNLPTTWESAGLDGLNGIVWFRKQINIPSQWQGKKIKLELGPIDDMDITYFNGTKVGETNADNSWVTPRKYTVPADIVNANQNTIAIKVTDTGGGGGIYGAPDQLKIYLASDTNKTISLAGDWKYSIAIDFKDFPPMPTSPALNRNQNTPTMLYNGMLAPVIPYAIKGVIWYQGESNTPKAYQYRTLFPSMIINWRTDWRQGNFPFYFTQIAPFDYGYEGICPELQEAQLLTLSLINTGMAVTTDIGNTIDVHPRNKQMVGQRLALWALAKNYGQRDLVYSGPLYKLMQTEGDKIRIVFDHTGSGLFSLGGSLKNFTIAGHDRKFVKATAEIDNNTVIVYSKDVKKPASVRYAWSNTAVGNLYNFEMLPASPFRTDDWPGVTYKKK